MRVIASLFTLLSLLFTGFATHCEDQDEVALDPKSGLRIDSDENWKLIKPHCTMCHSETLITQQRLDRANWLKTIRRMQSRENLWDLGDAEPKLLNYLSTFYGTTEKSTSVTVRRANLAPVIPIPIGSEQVDSKSSESHTSEDARESIDSPNSENESEDEN